MAEEETEIAEGAEGEARSRTPRTFASRAERSLKETDRLLKKSPDMPDNERAVALLGQAQVLALLDLADALRQNQGS